MANTEALNAENQKKQDEYTPEIHLPAIPAVWATHSAVHILSVEGEIKAYPITQAAQILHGQSVLVCHAPYTLKKIPRLNVQAFDLLELYAFVEPLEPLVPTPHGLATALGLDAPHNPDDYLMAMVEAVPTLLERLAALTLPERILLGKLAGAMGLRGRGWVWSEAVCAALGTPFDPKAEIKMREVVDWDNFPEWDDVPPMPPPDHYPVTGDESRARLNELLERKGHKTVTRLSQQNYTTEASAAFAPIKEEGQPNIVLAEAGTGTGKTLGYLAPASVYAEKNKAQIWVSTYTRNLQKQIAEDLELLYPDETQRKNLTAVRKGRENYLCLLNLEDATKSLPLLTNVTQAVAGGLMLRWAMKSPDGDLTGGGYHGWLGGLFGHANTRGLSDRRGECIYSACSHYRRCFVEKNVRSAKQASIVIANHALVMVNMAASADPTALPPRYIFDEGHHLLSAADSAFSANISGQECYDLRRWLRGPEGGSKRRARGLKKRCEDLLPSAQAEEALESALAAASLLPSEGWLQRLRNDTPQGPFEIFLSSLAKQVYARTPDQNSSFYSIECSPFPLADGMVDKINDLKATVLKIQRPLLTLIDELDNRLVNDADSLGSETRQRIEALVVSLERRAKIMLKNWVDMLDTLRRAEEELANDNYSADKTALGANTDTVDWFEVSRVDGQDYDCGYFRHYKDPLKPFSDTIRNHAQGLLITSATLTDQNTDDDTRWRDAFAHSGARHMDKFVKKCSYDSPFDYKEATRVLVINDVNKNDLDQVAAAYEVLFKASGGGALGLFTAIQRLRAIHSRIAPKLEKSGLSLYGQHVDAMESGTLIDIFRAEPNSCLLGTDAVRDGVDIPGDSLRLLVYDRVPWPRPDLLHKARREAFGQRVYDERSARMKIKQAYGRLIRHENDKGVFVMLDSALPTRLTNAFPEGVEVQRIGIAEATKIIEKFLQIA
ncbi:MAG: ATP-dependent DNA helicase [Alphaproteobacteria bacterium]|nr:ATP-dependent DNA helicase [Alphaproteobacteria bacterium]